MDFKIQDVKKGEIFGCAAADGQIITGIQYIKEDRISRWIYCSEMAGFTAFFSSDTDIFDDIIKKGDDKDYSEYLLSIQINELDGVRMNDFDEMREDINRINDPEKTAFVEELLRICRED